MERFLMIESNYQMYGELCDKCAKSIIGSVSNLNRRKLKRYCAFSSHSQADSQGVDNSKANKTPQHRMSPHIDMAFAQQMIPSTPAKIRRGVGTFQKRLLARMTISGYKEVFYMSDSLKKCFMWIWILDIQPVCPRPAVRNNNTTPGTTS
ncbi:hypothetical protein FGRMN_2940 [Fusarium graminum]|nr:hypothetical protein FGRMN_2940 [Fusarium graminum]